MEKIKFGIKGKMAAVFIAMGMLLSVSIGYSVYFISYRQVTAQYTELALRTAKAAAALVNGGSIEGYLTNGADEEYTATYAALRDLKSVFGLAYLYVFRPETNDNKYVVIFDISSDSSRGEFIAELGDEISGDEVYETVLQTYLTGYVEGSTTVTNTKYGWLASAYAPVYASDGSITAVIGADISMDFILNSVRVQTFQIAGASLGIAALLLIMLLFIIQRGVLRPIVHLSRHMEGFSSDEGKLEGIEVLRSGDELQTMSESFNRMVSDIKLYMENLSSVTADRERIATELNVARRYSRVCCRVFSRRSLPARNLIYTRVCSRQKKSAGIFMTFS